MTPLICSLFYAYFFLSVNYYRKEMIMRINNGYKHNPKVKPKAPRPVKATVFFIVMATATNFLVYAVYKDFLVIANTLPAAVCIYIQWRYLKIISKMDCLEE